MPAEGGKAIDMAEIENLGQVLGGEWGGEEALRLQVRCLESANVMVLGADGTVFYWNHPMQSLYGYSAEQALGRLSNELLQTRFLEPFETILAGLRAGKQWSGELSQCRADGEWIAVMNHWVPCLNGQGRLLFTVVTCLKINQKNDDDAAQARLAAIVESTDEVIISKTLDGIITSWNAAAERLLGYRAEEMIGQPISRIIPPDRLDEEVGILEQLRRGLKIERYETVRLTKDGRLLIVSLTISPIRSRSGRIIGASKILRDISERKQAETALVQAREHLEQIVAERTRKLRETVAELEAFCYSLSHDMRAPVRAIHSFMNLLQEDYGPLLGDEGRDYAQRSIRAARRMDRLIEDVLAFSRLSRQDIIIGSVNIDLLVRELVAEWPEFQQPRAEVRVEGTLLPVLGHESLLTQCITNLLGNAVKFVAPGVRPQVRIWTEAFQTLQSAHPSPRDSGSPASGAVAPRSMVRLWVADNGIGIDPAAHQRIFELFHRDHPNPDYEGTGIGLAIVRKAAERMQGRVGVESQPGQGSRFWIELPAAPASPPEPGAMAKETQPMP